VIVFSRTKHGADRIATQLERAGISADAIHGNKSQNARQKALSSFRSGQSRILVATDIAARGIDVDHITHVINFDLPHEPESYVHRIGRTARAGTQGIAISFCDETEYPLLREIEKLTRRTLDLAGGTPPSGPVASIRSARSGKSGGGGRGGRNGSSAGASHGHGGAKRQGAPAGQNPRRSQSSQRRATVSR
jgi:ATP-dependent RNA helicase RhlE